MDRKFIVIAVIVAVCFGVFFFVQKRRRISDVALDNIERQRAAALAEGRKWAVPLQYAFSNMNASVVADECDSVSLAVDQRGENGVPDKIYMFYLRSNSNSVSSVVRECQGQEFSMVYREDGSLACFSQKPNGFWMAIRANGSVGSYYEISNEYAVGAWYFFDEQGNVENNIAFEKPQKVVMEKNGRGDDNGELRAPEYSNDCHECEDQDENDFAEWDSRTGGGHTQQSGSLFLKANVAGRIEWSMYGIS